MIPAVASSLIHQDLLEGTARKPPGGFCSTPRPHWYTLDGVCANCACHPARVRVCAICVPNFLRRRQEERTSHLFREERRHCKALRQQGTTAREVKQFYNGRYTYKGKSLL